MPDPIDWSKFGPVWALVGFVVTALMLALGYLLRNYIPSLHRDHKEVVGGMVAAFATAQDKALETYRSESKAERDKCREDHALILERLGEVDEKHTGLHQQTRHAINDVKQQLTLRARLEDERHRGRRPDGDARPPAGG